MDDLSQHLKNMESHSSDDITSDTVVDKVGVDLRVWVEAARANPTLHRDRQVTEVVLNAIGLSPDLKKALILKGGTLMAIAFSSPRGTGDVDFSASVEPGEFSELLSAELDRVMPQAAQKLGYPDLVCRVQGLVRRPRPQHFDDADFPALEVRVASARRGDPGQMQALAERRAARVLKVEISFRDQVYDYQELVLSGANVAVQAFSPLEVVAEKFRALLQQPIRNRNRRQDVYDLSFLIGRYEFDAEARAAIHRILIAKARSRGIEPAATSIIDPEVVERARRDWGTLLLEIEELGDFDERFAVVQKFYESLPW
ncbi:hypothetical protein GCM10007291_49290 [Gemmobacter nanjingensis]|uniref:Nucleotidyl transferase AbiEii toxin, Type IV TA system n=2 Tax=Bacteria TaxID=2 RepID=A0ABQ3FUX7_9RHOB|nr:nucleotidyl transferase AbiEii/AbiGii toxin family protein [Gemmobacter nanjingensis]GHC41490.1 hypothetical protein GCM10007291_49290 [Gemmobacter nanjingensis]